MRGFRSLLILALILVALLVVGRVVTASFVDDGIDRYAEGTPERVVAETATRNAASLTRRMLLPRALFFLLPKVGATEVQLKEGHCTEYPPGSFPHLDYVAEVRVYTLFAIPVRSFTLQCGGNFL